MIVTRTPFRISFLGGGTDLPAFFREEVGAVLSTTISRYMYVTVHPRFDSSYRVAWENLEICEHPELIQHPILKQILKNYRSIIRDHQGDKGLEILSLADIPPGTGLGSSASFTVGALNALRTFLGLPIDTFKLAQEAAFTEIAQLGEPVGMQDHFAAALGGLRYIEFHPNNEVKTRAIDCSRDTYYELQSCVSIFYTGRRRKASQIYAELVRNAQDKRQALREMRDMARELVMILESGSDLSKFGQILHEGWQLKRRMAGGISADDIDAWYEVGRRCGAWGGKILGAGGGGFLMFMGPPEIQPRLREKLGLQALPFSFEKSGSQVLSSEVSSGIDWSDALIPENVMQ